MGNLLSRKALDPNDFEKILGDVDAKIRKGELNSTQIRSSERRFTLLFLAYTSLLYALLILYIFFYPNRSIGGGQVLWDGAMLVGGPFMIYWGKRMLSWWYRKRIGWVEGDLKGLKAKQKVEELKKKTAYYQTKGLLERFDPDLAKSSPAKKDEPKPKTAPPPTHQPPPPQNPYNPSLMQQPAQTQPQQQIMQPTIRSNAPNQTTPPMPYQFRIPTWYDRVLDTMIGDDRGSKYALICQKCYTHNGLVLPDEFESTQYVCPNCHYLNPARRPKTPVPASPIGENDDAKDNVIAGDESPPIPAIEESSETETKGDEHLSHIESTPIFHLGIEEPNKRSVRNRKKQK